MTITKPAIVAAALLALAACDNQRTRTGAPRSGTTTAPTAGAGAGAPYYAPPSTAGSTATTGVPAAPGALRTPTAPTPGDPTAPTANRPQGASPSQATGGGVPVPTRPGGAGGIGGGGQPGFGGTSTTGR